MQIRTLSKHGASLVVAIPPSYTKQLGWDPGQRLYVMLTPQQEIVITPVPQAPVQQPSVQRVTK